MRKVALLFLSILIITTLVPNKIFAQDVDSTTYRLVAPSIGESENGITTSQNFTSLNDSSPVDDFTTTSTNYSLTGGTAKFSEANVPSITCFETSTSSGTCSIGTNGMQEVCSSPGCYDRAKFLINAQNNPDDTRYAVQISTSSAFTSNVFYVEPVTRLIKSALTVSDFVYKCDWEGTTLAGFCGSSNTTWQKYNILGLSPNVTYYIRIAALHGSSTDGSFTQSAWSSSANTTTQNTSLSVDIDIATSTAGSSTPPYIISLGTMVAGSITTSTNYIITRLTTNAISGITMYITGTNGGLLNGVNLIANVNADLAVSTEGYGLRNDSTTNSSSFSSFIGIITVSSTPSDFTDAGATNKVGSPTTAFVPLFTSNSLPLHTGVSGYRVKAKPLITRSTGSYTETITYIPVGSY
ncbi:MAG: hypothetical protein ABI721_02920 [Candidatus Dojkabacteria bacterium]